MKDYANKNYTKPKAWGENTLMILCFIALAYLISGLDWDIILGINHD